MRVGWGGISKMFFFSDLSEYATRGSPRGLGWVLVFNEHQCGRFIVKGQAVVSWTSGGDSIQAVQHW